MGAFGVCMCGGGRGEGAALWHNSVSQRNCFEKNWYTIGLLHMFLSMRYAVL